ncbi:putative epoD protein [Burkholderia pseudomallei]|nr:putative epoD protein [Burkholderia pseudomallei]
MVDRAYRVLSAARAARDPARHAARRDRPRFGLCAHAMRRDRGGAAFDGRADDRVGLPDGRGDRPRA